MKIQTEKKKTKGKKEKKKIGKEKISQTLKKGLEKGFCAHRWDMKKDFID